MEQRRFRDWRRGPGSNRRIKVLQTSPLPLGYRASGCLRHRLRIVPHRSSHGPNPTTRCGMERETRLELATLALARRCSTTELLPLDANLSIPGGRNRVNLALPRKETTAHYRDFNDPRAWACARAAARKLTRFRTSRRLRVATGAARSAFNPAAFSLKNRTNS